MQFEELTALTAKVDSDLAAARANLRAAHQLLNSNSDRYDGVSIQIAAPIARTIQTVNIVLTALENRLASDQDLHHRLEQLTEDLDNLCPKD